VCEDPHPIIRFDRDITLEEAEEFKRRFLEAQNKPAQIIWPVPEPKVIPLTDPMRKFTSDDELRNRGAYHPPTSPAIVEAHEKIRAAYTDLALAMNNLLPECPLKTRALNSIGDAMMLANQTVALTQKLYGWDSPMDGRAQESLRPQADTKPVIDLGEAKLRCEQCAIPVVDGKHAWPFENQDNNHQPVL
jgi:hypothetical protein